MKKLLLSCFMLITAINPTYALNKNGTKETVVNVYGQLLPISEQDMWKTVYDMKYKSYMEFLTNSFMQMGIEPEYFMDDIKKYNECYADAFADELSVSDFELLMSTDTSEVLREAIINNIANKHVDNCRKKYQPYTDDLADFIEEYISRKCGTPTEAANNFETFTECLDEATKIMMQQLPIKGDE